MVDNSTGPLHPLFGLVCCDEAVRASHRFVESGSIPVLLLAHVPISPQDDPAPTSGCEASQGETVGKGQVSTSRAVHCRVVLPAAIAGVRCR